MPEYKCQNCGRHFLGWSVIITCQICGGKLEPLNETAKRKKVKVIKSND